jgi:cyclophilin family peptidyl-prolyl cis-trans isomerase/HEAT repeat protein
MSPAIFRACALVSALALATGCRSTDDASAFAPEGGSHGSSHALASGSSTEDPRQVIAKLEDERSDGEGMLEAYLSTGAESSRILAATALGRMPFPDLGEEGTHALAKALGDPSSRVRAAAAFAIGMRGDRSAAAALVEARPDRDPYVRARIVEAASRLDDPHAHALVIEALGDPDEVVREEAAVGPSRWKTDAEGAGAVDVALVRSAESTSKTDVEVVWRALFSLARRKSAAGRAVFESGLASSDPRARIFGAQGLRAIPTEGLALQKLRAALADADWRVACESALALGAHPHADAVPDLGKALAHPSPHVRRCAAEALAQFKDSKKEALQLLWNAKSDPSVDVRCSILVARAQLGADGIAADVATAAGDRNPLLRAGAAAAAGAIDDAHGLPLLLQLSRDRDAHVVDVAAHAMKEKQAPEVHERLVEMLADKDNGVRLAAADALKDLATPADLPALARCMDTSHGEISDEIRSTLVDTAGRLAKGDGGLAAKDMLQQASFSPNDFVRRKARALVLEVEPGTKFSGVPAKAAGTSKAPAVPLPGVDYPVAGPNPRVVIETSRGRMVFELLQNEAPVHVHNFLALAGRGFYDGTTFHRVVPDFVVQGGDPRGDGNGCTTYRGEALRGEFTPRKFVRGSLGMPRNDDPDSGGCQIFVTHRETPHLDGRYTLFGEMREGFDVLDRIELGDTIRTVRILDGAGTPSAPAN